MVNIIQDLVKLADYLDQLKLRAEADGVDAIIRMAVKRSGKDTWKYTIEDYNQSDEFSCDSVGIWSANTPDFAHRHMKEIGDLEVGKSVEFTTQVGEKVKVTRLSEVKVDDARTPPPPEYAELVKELKFERKSMGRKRRFISDMINEISDNKSKKLWPYLDKGRDHEEWRLEFYDQPDDGPMVSKIPLTEHTTDQEILDIAGLLIAAVQKLYSAN